jgi:hypothetical protein
LNRSRERLDVFTLKFSFYPEERPDGNCYWCVDESTHDTLEKAREKLGGLITAITGYMPEEVRFEEVSAKAGIHGQVYVEEVDEMMHYRITLDTLRSRA